ncbi:MAG TPA: YCF48-related protein [Chloroflexota bacterium]|jgi:photosystem II stability/assembly factor-like uncharacterized protein
MVAAAALLVFLGALAALAVPLLRRPSRVLAGEGADSPDAAADEGAAGLVEAREATLATLRELDFDFATGKLAEPDYEALRARYERRALALLKATDPAAAPPVHADIVHRNGLATPLASPPHPNGTARTAAVETRPTGRRRDRRLALGAGVVALAFVAGVAGIYLTGQRGQAEQRPVATLEGVGPRALAFVPAEAGRVYLAAAAGLLASGDGGASWQPVPSLDRALRAVAVSAARPTRVYAAGPGMLVVSDDGGRGWTTLPLALPDAAAPTAAGADVRALAADPDNADRLWLVAEGAGVYRSDDGGQTWTRTAATAPANATALAVVSGSAEAAAGDAEGPTLYVASATDGVLASADEGRTWGPASGVLNGALPTRRVSSMAFDANSGETATSPDGRTLRGTLYAGTELGGYRSLDRGQSWTRLGLAVPVAAVAAGGGASSGVLLAADREGAIYRSRDRGVTWDGN